MDQSKKLKTESDFAEESSASSSSSSSYRKIQKADRERLRRDKLNRKFLELRNSLDPNRPKTDKASILIDTIQMLKDLMNQVDRLKSEYATLSQESRELVQEKRELRNEKASLKSDIEILNVQYQHKVRTMVPWIPHYTYTVPVSIPQPCPLSGTQDPNLSSLLQSSVNPLTEQELSSAVSSKQDSKLPLDLNLMRNINHSDKKDDVGLELELKISANSSADQDAKEKKGSSKTTSSSPYS